MAEDTPKKRPTAAQIARRLALAYKGIFGDEGARTTDQNIVWDDMCHFCYAFRLVTEKDARNRIDPKSAEFFDGRRSWWLRARGQVLRAGTETTAVPIPSRTKPKE